MRSLSARFFEIDFREGQVEGGRRIADDLFHLVPVFRLGGELVAGDDCPFGQVGAGFGQIDLRDLNAKITDNFHGHILHQLSELRGA